MSDFADKVIEKAEEVGHIGVARDMVLREQIPEPERCKRCTGSGNELMFMYRRCQACMGDGRSRGNEAQFSD